MDKVKNKDTRYFIELELATLKLTRCGFDQKENLNKGLQEDASIHRVFISQGQYNKLIERGSSDLTFIVDA